MQDFDDVRVRELLADRRLVKEQPPVLGLFRLLRQQNLHREVAEARYLDDFEDLRTLAGLQKVLNAVVTDLFIVHAGPSHAASRHQYSSKWMLPRKFADGLSLW